MPYWLKCRGLEFTNVTCAHVSLARTSHKASLGMTGDGGLYHGCITRSIISLLSHCPSLNSFLFPCSTQCPLPCPSTVVPTKGHSFSTLDDWSCWFSLSFVGNCEILQRSIWNCEILQRSIFRITDLLTSTISHVKINFWFFFFKALLTMGRRIMRTEILSHLATLECHILYGIIARVK